VSHTKTQDLRVEGFEPIESPQSIQGSFPLSEKAAAVVLNARNDIRKALAGEDDRLVVIVGPCSIHDRKSALDYANRLVGLREELSDRLQLIMRVYFEKPRTTIGWKGFINDPALDGSCDINRGLREGRGLMLEINELGLPCATEFLDPIVPQYISDLVAWAAIGARTTESQTHREMASGLSMPVGFKNATDGGMQIALDGMTAAEQPHAFLGITPQGSTCVVRTRGNPDVHLVMRGGAQPNYKKPHVAFAKSSLDGFSGKRLIMVDCSHGNSNKDYRRQPETFDYLLELAKSGEEAILGMMLESHLVEGKQSISGEMVYGRSLTDGCIGWDTTEDLLRRAHARL